MDGDPLLVDARLASQMLGLPTWRVWEMARRGEIPHKKIGRRSILFSPAALREWARQGSEVRETRVVE